MAFAVLLLVAHAPAGAMQSAPAQSATPVDPITAIVEAFRTYNIVTLSDPHGNVQVQAFLLSLVRDPRFPDVVNDIVIETASARYQDAIDRFVRGEDVETAVLRRAWEDHTVANSLGVQAEELIRAVRTRQCVPERSQEIARRRGRSANRLGQHHLGTGRQTLD